MAVSAAVVAVGGAANSAIGAYGSASGQKASLQYQAAMGSVNAALARSDASLLDVNAGLSETQARMAIMQGQREEQQMRLRTAQIKGTQRAAMAANGVDLGEGSSSRILATTDYMGEIDVGTIRANAARTAFGYRIQAANQKFAAMSARVQGANYTAGSAFASANAAGISPFASGMSSLMTSAASYGPQVYGMGKSAGWWG